MQVGAMERETRARVRPDERAPGDCHSADHEEPVRLEAGIEW